MPIHHAPLGTWSRRRWIAAAAGGIAAAAGLPGTQGRAWAQTAAAAWPAKPITIVVNVPPGSSPDVVARAVAGPLQTALGQPVLVENRSGAAGNVGAESMLKAAPDGYTLLMSAGSTITANPSIYPQMRFRPLDDLIPVAAVARVIMLLCLRKDFEARNVAEFLAYAKAHPGKLTYGSAGSGSMPHIAAEMMKVQAGLYAVHVPYRGAAPALQDLLAGQVDFVFDPGIAISHVKAGRLRLVAVADKKRSALFPDVPTLGEAGLKDFDAGTTHGFYAPAGTPAALVERINAEVNKTLALPAVRSQIASLGAEPTPMSPAAFRQLLADETRVHAAVIKAQGIQAD